LLFHTSAITQPLKKISGLCNFIKNVCESLVINENMKKFPPFLTGLSFMNLLFKVAAKVFKKSASGSD